MAPVDSSMFYDACSTTQSRENLTWSEQFRGVNPRAPGAGKLSKWYEIRLRRYEQGLPLTAGRIGCCQAGSKTEVSTYLGLK